MNDELGERVPNSRPVPDPTVLTTEQLLRAIAAERDYVEGRMAVLGERLDGIDRATILREENFGNFRGRVDEKVGHLAELTEERFESVATQFKERDTRAEREARDNKVAVDAAFAAQKEAAGEQNRSNMLAITKSEIATMETINKLTELFETNTGGLSDKIADLKERVSRIESRKEGATEKRTEEQASVSSTAALVGIVIAAIILAISVYAATRPNDAQSPQIITVPQQMQTP